METNCRICFDEPGTYNIFTDEFLFDSKPSRQIKIYIILNNFLHEKLYTVDEFSQLICNNCCNSLSESFSFMTKIRSSEEKLKNLQTRTEPSQLEAILPGPSVNIHQTKHKIHNYSDFKEDEEPTEILSVLYASDSPSSPTPAPAQIQKIPIRAIQQNKRKKCSEKDSEQTSSFAYTHYELEKESGKNVISLSISQKELDLSVWKDVENISFDLSYMNHADDNFMYKCNFCIKAFSTSELLVKHTVISHLCVFCHKIFANYKELNLHLKNDPEKNLLCKFCDNYFDHSAYRQHLKVKHKLTSPIHIGIT